MEKLGNNQFNAPAARFALDNLRDGFKDDSLVVWEAYDTLTGKSGWLVGRKVTIGGELRILPCAGLLESQEAIGRYAPSLAGGGWDYSQIAAGKRIIIPP